jgi:hypothetical protein
VKRAWAFAASAALCGMRAQATAAPSEAAPAQSEADRDDVCIARHRDAQAHGRQGRLLRANEALRQCLSPECSPVLREDCARLLSEVERDMPSVVFVAESAEGDLVQVTVYDGEHRIASSLDGTALWLDPGEHHFTFQADGRVPVSRSVMLRVGERNRRVSAWLDLLPPRQPAPKTRLLAMTAPLGTRRDPTLTYSLLGAGAALGVSGIWLGVSARNNYVDAEASCAPLCSPDVQREIRVKALAADGLFVLSGALLVWGAVRLFSTGNEAKGTTVSLGAGLVTAKGRF